jgi:uncharacterized membrane protein
MNPNFGFGPGRGFRGDGGTVFLAGHHGDHPLAWAIFALLLVVLLLSAATLALELARGRRGPRTWRPAFAERGPAPPPEVILATRYARGELTRDEFLRSLDDVRGRAPRPDDAPTVEQEPPPTAG